MGLGIVLIYEINHSTVSKRCAGRIGAVGCDQNSPGNSARTPSSNSRMSHTNGMMGGTTNMSATNSTPEMNMPTISNATGAANDATR